ncbi:MAG TPA: hypothetical protein VIU34_28240 [Steroidobacter sp.]
MTPLVARFGMNVLLFSVAIPAIAAQSEQTPSAATHAPFNVVQQGSSGVFQESGEQGAKVQGRLSIVTGEQANELAQRLKERLADPEQRVALRAEQRASVSSTNIGVGRLVGLDHAMEQKLIELLTDQQLARLEQMYLEPRPTVLDLQKLADETTQRMNALAKLLGEEKLERFQAFEMSQSARYWVGQFSAQLASADKLQPDQEDRLTALKQEQFEISSAAIGSWRAFRRPVDQPISFEDMQRDSQRQGRIANENAWRKRQVEHQALEQKAAAFLTSAQLATLSKYQAQEQDNMRRFIESARVEAGLAPTLPDPPEGVEETSQPIDVQVQVEVSLTVNRTPTTVMHTVRTGESFTFKAAPGLIAEATPMMYDDDWIDVHLKYYEEGATGRRRLSGGTISTTQARQSDGSPGGSSGTVITGRKGYAVEASIKATVL